MSEDGVGALHFTFGDPGLPREQLYEVEVEERRTPERIRASDEEEAKKRVRQWLGLTPVDATIVDEGE